MNGVTLSRIPAAPQIARGDRISHMDDWPDESLAMLENARHTDGGWAYFDRGDSAVEPTAMAVAALYAHSRNEAAQKRGLDFIGSLQQSDGAIAPQTSQTEPSTLCAVAAITLAVCGDASHRAAAARVADYLLSYDPATSQRMPHIADDSTLRGFAWRPTTYSWVEPTAYVMLLMSRLNRREHPRMTEARRMMFDRAVPTGGWNYGNSAVFNTPLEPAVMPTALALLALWDQDAGPRGPAPLRLGIEYLMQRVNDTPSVLSLGWISMALRGRGFDAVLPGRFGELFAASNRSANSPWHRGVALLATADVSRNPFIIRG